MHRPGLGAAVGLGEHERERGVGLRVSVVVDIDAVDRVGVEVGARHERIHVQDQHRLARALRRREHEEVRQVEARIVTWELEHGGTEVVGHRGSFLVGGRAAGPTQQARRYARE